MTSTEHIEHIEPVVPVAPWSKTLPFKVDIAGVIHLMGSALYSRPQAAIRELVQNAHDAIMRHRMVNLTYTGQIDVIQNVDKGTLEFHDDGTGLSAEDAEQYLGTLGIGMTGMLKGEHPSSQQETKTNTGLIGQFGIGLFSAFMIADELIVTSRRRDDSKGICWKAGPGTDIELSSCEREAVGTTVQLRINPEHQSWAMDAEILEKVIKEYADFLTIPIVLNRGPARINVIYSQWFEPTPDEEALELEISTHFEETPLDVIPINCSTPIPVTGALYVSPQRTPGFSDQSVVTSTIQRMVVSRRVQDLLPEWAPFLRGVLELPGCRPTTSREDLIRDPLFWRTAEVIECKIFERFEYLAEHEPSRFESILSWHRYMLAGAALTNERLRKLLSRTYRFNTSKGNRTAVEILEESRANPLFETEFDRVVWFNTDRRQEALVNTLFANQTMPCVHTVRSFEESLLASIVSDFESAETGEEIDIRLASLNSPGFSRDILQVSDMDPAPSEWQEFLGVSDAQIMCAAFRNDQPVLALLNEKHELLRSFDDLKKEGTIPSAFQRLIDRHFDDESHPQNEVVLNTNHRLVARALEQKTSSPLASVLRLLVFQALATAGASSARQSTPTLTTDLDWIAESLWGRD